MYVTTALLKIGSDSFLDLPSTETLEERGSAVPAPQGDPKDFSFRWENAVKYFSCFFYLLS